MIIPDINILVHAYNSDSPRHRAARVWWERTLRGPRPVGLPWATMLGFIRIMTHGGILEERDLSPGHRRIPKVMTR